MSNERKRSSSLPSAEELGVTRVVHFDRVASTMDEAHLLAQENSSSGILVVADEQTAGRGRSGNSWESRASSGVWCTLIERPTDSAAVDVLSIRLGLAIARAMEPLSEGEIQLKWPNDVFLDGRKLAGILVEARWRDGAIDWVAIGIGLNLLPPETNALAASLGLTITRREVLLRLIPEVRKAAQEGGSLSNAELLDWSARDYARGRSVAAPVKGVVAGLAPSGAIRVVDDAGVEHELRSGSLVFV